VLAPNAKLRSLVVQQGPLEQGEPSGEAAAAAECEDMQHCPNCGAGELKIIAAILERPVIERILTHLG
jgi:hypothetical protein